MFGDFRSECRKNLNRSRHAFTKKKKENLASSQWELEEKKGSLLKREKTWVIKSPLVFVLHLIWKPVQISHDHG